MNLYFMSKVKINRQKKSIILSTSSRTKVREALVWMFHSFINLLVSSFCNETLIYLICSSRLWECVEESDHYWGDSVVSVYGPRRSRRGEKLFMFINIISVFVRSYSACIIINAWRAVIYCYNITVLVISICRSWTDTVRFSWDPSNVWRTLSSPSSTSRSIIQSFNIQYSKNIILRTPLRHV